MRLEVEEFAEKLLELGATSVFLYGSRARGDNLPDSDWEIGAIFEEDKYKHRAELQKQAPKGIVVYPYKLDDFKGAEPLTPFNNAFWLTEIIKTSKTLAGNDIINSFDLPEITHQDFVEELAFCKARAVDAMLALRSGYGEFAKDIFVKSCMYGLRLLLVVSGKDFPTSYQDIANSSAVLLPDELSRLPDDCLAVRDGRLTITNELIFQNINMLTEVVQEKVK